MRLTIISIRSRPKHVELGRASNYYEWPIPAELFVLLRSTSIAIGDLAMQLLGKGASLSDFVFEDFRPLWAASTLLGRVRLIC